MKKISGCKDAVSGLVFFDCLCYDCMERQFISTILSIKKTRTAKRDSEDEKAGAVCLFLFNIYDIWQFLWMFLWQLFFEAYYLAERLFFGG